MREIQLYHVSKNIYKITSGENSEYKYRNLGWTIMESIPEL